MGRVIQRTCEVMNEYPDADVREHGAIPLEIVQRYINFWNASSNDLFGGEISSNASNFFASGLKGRAYEEKLDVDHLALNDHYDMEVWENGRLSHQDVPLRNAMNEVLRDEYVKRQREGHRVLQPHRREDRSRLPLLAAPPSLQPIDRHLQRRAFRPRWEPVG